MTVHPVGEPRTVAESQTILVKWMGITDANHFGNVHGGTVMRLCDEVAGLAAMKHSHRRVVTAAVDQMNFLHAINVGEVLTLRASVNAVWRTSMEVGVRVEAEDPRTGVVRHTNSAYLTMVALDEEGHPASVRPLALETRLEERRHREAQLRRTNRLAERAQVLRERGE